MKTFKNQHLSQEKSIIIMRHASPESSLANLSPVGLLQSVVQGYYFYQLYNKGIISPIDFLIATEAKRTQDTARVVSLSFSILSGLENKTELLINNLNNLMYNPFSTKIFDVSSDKKGLTLYAEETYEIFHKGECSTVLGVTHQPFLNKLMYNQEFIEGENIVERSFSSKYSSGVIMPPIKRYKTIDEYSTESWNTSRFDSEYKDGIDRIFFTNYVPDDTNFDFFINVMSEYTVKHKEDASKKAFSFDWNKTPDFEALIHSILSDKKFIDCIDKKMTELIEECIIYRNEDEKPLSFRLQEKAFYSFELDKDPHPIMELFTKQFKEIKNLHP